MEMIVLSFLICYTIISLVIQKYLNNLYNKYTNEEIELNVPMNEFLLNILKEKNIAQIQIKETNKLLNDNYNLKTKTIQLSKEQYTKTTLSSLAVSMHECGHALQDYSNYGLLKIRNFFFRPLNLICYISLFLTMVGIVISPIMWKIGIGLIITYFFFQLITVNIELDASKRAMEIIEEKKILNNTQKKQIKNLLKTSALNYIFSMFSGLLQTFR